MNRIFATALVLGPLLLAACEAGHRMPEPLGEDISGWMAEARVPGLVMAKVENGRVAWSAAFGERAPGEAMTTTTLFNVASLTKPVFASTVMHLVSENRLSLDEPISQYWVDPDVTDDPRHQKLTPRILLSHQSGFPNWRGNDRLRFMFEPGARHEYSGEGYEYLRRALERKTGQTLPELVAEQILHPLSMGRTSLGWSDNLGDDVVTGFDEAGEPIDTGLRARRPNAAANLMTTVDDYARFAAWIARGADLPEPLLGEMGRPQAMHTGPAERFGLGWKLVPLGGHEALMHDGREPGVRTFFIVLPQTKEALTIFTNSSNGELLFRPIVEASLPMGSEIMASMDRLVWTYLQRLPPQALLPLSRTIARSPSFLSTLLHAVDVALIQPASLPEAEKAEASRAIDPYVFALFNHDIQPEQVEALMELLLEENGEGFVLHDSFDAETARSWVLALGDTS